MNGTLLNTATILVFGAFAALTGRQLSQRVQIWFKYVLGAFTVFFGFRLVYASLNGPARLVGKQLLVVLAALIVGRLAGRLLRLQKLSNHLGQIARVRLEAAAPGKPAGFGDGFQTCTILFCAAPLAMLGAVADGLLGDYHPLVVKALMDGLAAMAFVPMFRWGAVAAALPVLAWQGTIALLVHAAAPELMRLGLADSVGATAGFLVSFVALLIFEVRSVRIADYLPSLVLAPLLTWLWR